MKYICIIFLLALQLQAWSQKEKVYNISIEARNAAIELVNKATIKINKGLVKESFSLITEAIKTDSTLHNSYDLLYRACLTDANYSNPAIQNFYIAERIFDLDDEICFYLAELYRLRNEHKKAIPEYTKAIEYSKSSTEKSKLWAQYFSGRAFCYTKTNNFKAAILDYDTYLKEKPMDAVILINRGVCYQKLGNMPMAIVDWKRSEQLGNPTGKVYLDRATKK
ncbi:MAG TPA: hypothetical protein VFC36_06515 [Paludibacter sp.]|nr:hypothetical protein [Paludibacter sp.]